MGSPSTERFSDPPLRGRQESRCAVVILNWNRGPALIRCLESVIATTPEWVRVIVVDNASADGSPDAAAQIPRVEVWKNETNLGFAAAYNRAILRCSEAYVALLNPDTLLDRPGWVESLIAVAERDSAIAVVGCTLLFADDPNRINSAGGMVYWWTGPVDVGFGEPVTPASRAGHEPFAASGGAMLIRRDRFLEMGGFDEGTFLYIEDVDLCWRLRLRRLKVGFAPDVFVRHSFSTSLGALSVGKVYYSHRNYLRAMLRNYSMSTLIWALPAYGMWSVVKLVGALFVERSPSLAAGVVRALGWNALMLRDTLRTRRAIQAGRVVDDRTIRREMGPRGFESRASLRSRWAIAHARMTKR